MHAAQPLPEIQSCCGARSSPARYIVFIAVVAALIASIALILYEAVFVAEVKSRLDVLTVS